jgi:hypothetical protein
VPIKNDSVPVNFIIHKGDEKDPGPDQSMTPNVSPTVWVRSGNETLFTQGCRVNDQAIFHYHRPAGDFGDYNSDNYVDFWGLHTWGDAADPGWTTPRKPARASAFGQVFEVPLINNKGDRQLHLPPRRHQGSWPGSVAGHRQVGL